MSSFFEELNSEPSGGVANKNVNLTKTMISYLANVGDATIAELSKEINLSVPKVATLVNDLIAEGIVEDNGKIDTVGGRKPNSYGLVADSAFFLGVDVKQTHINIGLTDFRKNLVKTIIKHPYELTDTQESLDELCRIINDFIKHAPIKKKQILGIGINLSGRINHTTGYSYSFFNFNEEPLSKTIESFVGLPVFLENDSKAMAYGEFHAGVVNGEKDVLFLNIDMGLGMGIIVNGQLYYGKSGYAGEFGHIPIFENEIICRCGKKGCLETEASGLALLRMFKEKIGEGSSSLLTQNSKKNHDITLEDIISAANKDDTLSIDLIAAIGTKLGRGIALLINIFNPELVILGGSIAMTDSYIRLPIKSAINKYSLNLVSIDTQVKTSVLGETAGIVGACLLVRNRLISI